MGNGPPSWEFIHSVTVKLGFRASPDHCTRTQPACPGWTVALGSRLTFSVEADALSSNVASLPGCIFDPGGSRNILVPVQLHEVPYRPTDTGLSFAFSNQKSAQPGTLYSASRVGCVTSTPSGAAGSLVVANVRFSRSGLAGPPIWTSVPLFDGPIN